MHGKNILRPASRAGQARRFISQAIIITREKSLAGLWHGACSLVSKSMIASKVAKMADKNRILIVDDDEVVRWSYLRSLEGISCNVEAASDGEQALQTMERSSFDVVLLDMRMPGQDGLSVLRTIKQRWPESEVIIITGYPSVDSAKEAVQLGAYDYVSKPVGPQDVVTLTDGAITRKHWTLHRMQEEPDAASGTGTA